MSFIKVWLALFHVPFIKNRKTNVFQVSVLNISSKFSYLDFLISWRVENLIPSLDDQGAFCVLIREIVTKYLKEEQRGDAERHENLTQEIQNILPAITF